VFAKALSSPTSGEENTTKASIKYISLRIAALFCTQISNTMTSGGKSITLSPPVFFGPQLVERIDLKQTRQRPSSSFTIKRRSLVSLSELLIQGIKQSGNVARPRGEAKSLAAVGSLR
jgi:hypothetical protein